MYGGYVLGFSLSFGIFLFIISYFFNDYYNNSKKIETEEITFLSAMIPFSLYIIFSASCYTLEYTWHAMFHPETLDFNTFILYTHSRAFHVALLKSPSNMIVIFLFFGFELYSLMILCVVVAWI